MLGIGLGGFASGVETGVGIGTKLSKIRAESKKASAFKDAYSQGSAGYNSAVESGDATAGDLDGPMRYAMPHIMQQLFESGDIDGAERASKWFGSDKAIQGSRLFASGLLMGKNGDMDGALNDLTESAGLKGYGPGYDMGYERLEGGRYRGWIKDKGKTFSREFDTGDNLIKFFAERSNPQAMWKLVEANQIGKIEDDRAVKKAGGIARAKTTAELEGKYLSKKLGLGTTKPSDNIKARKDAIEELKNKVGAEWDEASEEKRERMIQKRKALILGRDDDGDAVGVSSAPRRKVFVESRTGKLISD